MKINKLIQHTWVCAREERGRGGGEERYTLDIAKSCECMPFWSRLKLGPSRSINATKHQNASDSSSITYNIGDKRSLIPCKTLYKLWMRSTKRKETEEFQECFIQKNINIYP